MLEIAVCEDERYEQGRLEEMLCSLRKKLVIQLEVDVYESGEALLAAVHKGEQYDLIYLDIELGEGINGLQVAEQLRKQDRNIQIVYVTNYEQYLKKSILTMPSGYLMKPVKLEELEENLVRISGWISGKDEYYRFKYNNVSCRVLLRDIRYIKSDKRRGEIFTKDGKQETYKKLNEIEVELSRRNSLFLRIHQSYLVNYSYIDKFRHNEVTLTTGEILPMSRRQKVQVEKILNLL